MSQVETLSPYGYRIAAGDPEVAFIPETRDEPLAAEPVQADPSGRLSYAGSGQPVGPDLWRRVVEAADTPEGAEMLRRLLRVDVAPPREFVYEGVVGFETDGSGNATCVLFDVPQGARAFLTRCLFDVDGQNPGSAVIAASWVGVYETGGGTSEQGVTTATYRSGRLRAFAPQNASSGLFLPQLLVDQDDQAWGFRSGMRALAVLDGAVGIANHAGTVAFRFNVRFDQAAV